MKKRIVLLLLLLLLVALAPDTAAPQPGSAPDDEAAVRALDDQAHQAVLNRNYAPLERLWCEAFAVNAPNNQVIVGRENVLAVVKRVALYSLFERKIEHLSVHGDIAIVMGAETVRPAGDAPQTGQTIERRFTNIWKRNGATWCAIARHANVRPPATTSSDE